MGVGASPMSVNSALGGGGNDQGCGDGGRTERG